jgi:hypothetical protein
MGLPIAPRGLRPRLIKLREFLHGVPFEQLSPAEANDE